VTPTRWLPGAPTRRPELHEATLTMRSPSVCIQVHVVYESDHELDCEPIVESALGGRSMVLGPDGSVSAHALQDLSVRARTALVRYVHVLAAEVVEVSKTPRTRWMPGAPTRRPELHEATLTMSAPLLRLQVRVVYESDRELDCEPIVVFAIGGRHVPLALDGRVTVHALQDLGARVRAVASRFVHVLVADVVEVAK